MTENENLGLTEVAVYCQGGMMLKKYLTHETVHLVKNGVHKFNDVNGNHITLSGNLIVVTTTVKNTQA